MATGKLVHRLTEQHSNSYSRICFSRDSKCIAALADDMFGGECWEIDIWDAGSGRHTSKLKGPKEWVRSLTFSADGKTLLVGGSGKALSFRDASTGKEVRRLRDLPADASDLILSPRGDRAAFIEWREEKGGGRSHWDVGERAFLVDLRTGAELRRWAVPSEDISSGGTIDNNLTDLAFSPDGGKLAACSAFGPVHLWDTSSGKEVKYLSDGSRYSSSVAFSPDGRTLAAVRGDRVIRLIDPATGADRVAAKAHPGNVLSLAVTNDGRTAFTAADSGTIYRWDARTGRERGRLLGHKPYVYGLALSADDRTLFSASFHGTLRVWDVASGKERRRFQSWMFYNPFALSPDGAMLAAGNSRTLLLFDPARGKRLHERHGETPILAAAFSADSSRVTALTDDRAISRWETATGRPLSPWIFPRDDEDRLESFYYVGALSSDGRLAASADSFRFLRVLDVEAKREICRLAKPPGLLSTIVFAPDGRTLAWAEGYGVIHWLELASGRERRTLPGHAGWVRRMVFTADSRLLLSGSDDATVLVWDLVGSGPATLSAEKLSACWTDLADKDAARAYRAMRSLIAAPADAVAYLRPRLKAVEGVDEKRIEQRIAELDSDAFAEREMAAKELRQLGDLAEPALRKALASRPTLEMSRRLRDLLDEIGRNQWRPSTEQLRQLRAVEVLERNDTPETRALLEALARGAAGARLTREARAASHRLRHR